MLLTRHRSLPGFATGLLGLLCLLSLGACSIIQSEDDREFNAAAAWVLLPLDNYSQTRQASERAESILTTLLRSHGITQLSLAPDNAPADALPFQDNPQRYRQALAWAQSRGAEFGVTGTIEEWRYKSGLDGEPAAGISLRVIDIRSGEILWSASAARSGWSRESLSGNAQKVLSKLVNQLPLSD